jgi:hypothetical protein
MSENNGKDEILAAIAGLSDRLSGIEKRLAAVEDACTATNRMVEQIDHKLNAVARKVLSGGECVAIGIPDARGLRAVAGGAE